VTSTAAVGVIMSGLETTEGSCKVARRRKKADDTPGVAAPKPAPGELEIIQSLVNTASREGGPDVLATPRDLARWLANRGLVPTGTELTEEERRRALEVREGLGALLWANSGGEPDREALRRLDRATADARFQAHFDETGPIGFEPASAGLDNALGRLLEIVVMARREGRWSLLKACWRPECRRAFYDTSQASVGRWCCQRCGNRARGRRHRGSG